MVSNGTGVGAGKSPGGKPTWHKDLEWEYSLYKPKALGRPEITFHFTLSSRLALWPRHPGDLSAATASDGLQGQQRFVQEDRGPHFAAESSKGPKARSFGPYGIVFPQKRTVSSSLTHPRLLSSKEKRKKGSTF